MVLLQWIHEEKYDKIVNLLGGFHTIMVKLKIMNKKYGALEFIIYIGTGGWTLEQ